MDHGEAAERGDRVGESGAGDDQHHGRQPHQDRRSDSPAELGDADGTELANRGRFPARTDAGDIYQGPLDAEVVPPPNQPALPGFDTGAFAISYSARSSPYPTAAELAEYDRFMPGLAREIVNEAHANMASDRKINELAVETSAKLDIRGQVMAGAICGVCISFAFLCLFLLSPPWLAATGAGIFGLGAIAPVINAFLQRGGAKDSGSPPPRPTPPPTGDTTDD